MLVRNLLGAVLGGRRKRSHAARRFLTQAHGGRWARPVTLLAAAGVAWGVIETLRRSRAAGVLSGSEPARAAPPLLHPPPLPGAGDEGEEAGIDAGALRLIRLAISAATADGPVNDQERAAILQQATAAGLADLAARELSQPRAPAGIVAGVTGVEERATLYVLAFTIVRADEQVTASERLYLSQLATLLHLDPQTVAALEQDTGERIDALGDQGQLGG